MTRRILLISRCPPYPLHLGDRLIIGNLFAQLAQRGYVVDLLAFADRPTDHADTVNYQASFGQITLLPEPRRSLPAYLRRLGQPFPQCADQAWSAAMWQAIQDQRRAATYDLIHLFGGVQVYEYRALVQDLPNLIVPYESYSLYLRRQAMQARTIGEKLMARLRLSMAQRYERQMFSGFDGVVVLTEADAAALRALSPNLPLHVIPNGVNLPQAAPNVPTEGAHLLFVGNYEYAPNLDAALWLAREIFPLIKARLPHAELWLVGNAPPPVLRACAAPDIHVTGHVPSLTPYYERAALFLSPLRFGAGIKNKVLEAMAMALPVVATPLSVDGIAADEGVRLAESAAAFAEQSIMLLADAALRARLGAENRAVIAARYTWSAVADAYEVLYEQIIHLRR
ncbi:MAG: glycosyltransferase [Chloroflexi bacterium CFX4]|nr:glycosyltransferase [Chloroflexi bacterium CFX4]MDL1921032.1 glycosyltransferase [Chloroflexi bacterium CFX3]